MARISDSNLEPLTNGAGRFAIGLICGAAVGATLGLLFAPKSGAETRQDLMRTADKLRRRAKQTSEDVAAVASDLIDEGVDLVNDTVQRGTERLRDYRGSSSELR